MVTYFGTFFSKKGVSKSINFENFKFIVVILRM